MRQVFSFLKSVEIERINSMKKLMIFFISIFACTSFAGVGFTNNGRSINLNESLITKHGIAADPKVEANLLDFATRLQGDRELIQLHAEPALAYKIKQLNGKTQFQTAVPVNGSWDIRTWQAEDTKIDAMPKLKNALEESMFKRDWQQLRK